MTNSRIITSTLDAYQKARQQFAQSLSDLAQRAQNCPLLLPALPLLGPLLTTGTASEVNLAALTISRIAVAGYADELYQAGLVTDLMKALAVDNLFGKGTSSTISTCKNRAINCALKNIAKQSKTMAECVVEAGVLPKLVQCLSEFEPTTRESAALCLATIAQHSELLAHKIVKLGVLQSLTSALQEPELALRVSAAVCITEIAKHSAELAQIVVEVGAVFVLAKLLDTPSYDSKIKKTVITALSSIAKHGAELSETVIEADIYPGALLLLKDPDEGVRRCAMILAKEICKQSVDLSQLMVSIGTVGATVDYLDSGLGSSGANGGATAFTTISNQALILPAILTLGFIAAHSESLASSVVAGRSVNRLGAVIEDSSLPPTPATINPITNTSSTSNSGANVNHDENIVNNSNNNDNYFNGSDGLNLKLKCSAVWALGQIGQHSAEHARALTLVPAVLQNMLNCALSKNGILATKSSNALKLVIQRCTELPSLEPLILCAPRGQIRNCLLAQFAKVLPNDPSSRKSFVVSGCLKAVQEFELDAGSDEKEHRLRINHCFPPEIVKYYSPGYPDDLLSRIENFSAGANSSSPLETNSGAANGN